MIPSQKAKSEFDPAALEKALELSSSRNAPAWKEAKGRRATLRTLAYLFLFLVIAAPFTAIFSPAHLVAARPVAELSRPEITARIKLAREEMDKR